MLPKYPVQKASNLMFSLTQCSFFAGYLVLDVLCKRGALGGCLAFVLGILAAKLYDRVVASKRETVYTITGFGQTLSGELYEGDNDLD